MHDAIENQAIALEKRLAYDKLGFYYLSLPVLLFGNLMGAFLLSAIQLHVVETYSIIVWLSLTVIMFLYGLYQYRLFRKESEENKLKNANIWLDKYYTDTLINGIIWGSSAFLMFPASNLLNQMLVIFFLFAIGFTAMGILASKRDLLITYISVMYLPIIMRLFFMEGDTYRNIGYILLALILIMAIVANYYGKVINNSLENRQDFITIKQTHEKLKERFFSLFERAPVGIYYYNKEMKLEDANEHFVQMNERQEKQSVLNAPFKALQSSKVVDAHQAVFEGNTGEYRGPFRSLEDSDLYVKLSTVPMINSVGEVAGGIAIINDITSEVTAKEKMIRNAYYDLLTNIPNRTLLMDKLRVHILQKKQHQEFGALLFMDVDNFKKVNEIFGHDAGDNLLKQVTGRIERILGENELFARISGDKFVLLLPSLHADREDTEQMIKKYIGVIRDTFIKPLRIAGEEYHLSLSTGIVLFNQVSDSAFDLLKKAETAMYEAKKSARGTLCFYKSIMGAFAKKQLILENDMHNALVNDEFSIVYQPQIDIATDTILGVEALVRWEHPEKGYISPEEFISVAEESGTIIRLEEWIFNRIFEELQTYSDAIALSSLDRVAVNVSTVHFMQPNFVEKFMLLVSKYKIDPTLLEIEITEGSVIENLEYAKQKIHELKAFGLRFAIDDFGTGHSSLAYLKELPVDVIKIDKSFVENIQHDEGDAMIVKSVVIIGHTFDLEVLAEGIEDAETLAYLKEIGCDIYQGYYGYKPMEITKLFAIAKHTQRTLFTDY